ncbi:hypothetical protein CKM354_000869500 [Cercospora kikuchii]|uniref:Rhodopsin domain-containing protein n=1 Tax=Cercospora kikuchii TaxID=84275 RepID=A0A9P3CML4_9PEZI|nr:uncharacterized protein CKM354_000869500 [Cercospora kikuchii]GIZ45533.1 hypothetical protein CKM354_000869500 [Cercospora kikuchii]
MAPVQEAPELQQHFSKEFLEQTLQPNIRAAAVVPLFLAIAAVLARLWCRWKRKAGYKLDDFLIVLALLACIVVVINDLIMVNHGLGKHIYVLGPEANHYLHLGWFIAEFSYTVAIVAVKLSILALYYRTFAPLNIKWEVVIMTVFTVLWGSSVFICMMLHCVPLRKYWDPDVPGVCNLDNQKYLFAISIPNILIDVILLGMPVRYVLMLEMGRRQKQTIAGLFLFGGFVCVASIMRLISVSLQDDTSPDTTWVPVNQAIWATVEILTAIISACLPCLGPILSHLWPSAFSNDRAPSVTRLRQWTYGSEPRRSKKNSTNNTLGAFTDTLLLTRTEDTLVADGTRTTTIDHADDKIKVKNEWNVQTVRADSMSSQHKGSWDKL